LQYHVHLDYPTIHDAEKLLAYYLQKVPLAETISIPKIIQLINQRIQQHCLTYSPLTCAKIVEIAYRIKETTVIEIIDRYQLQIKNDTMSNTKNSLSIEQLNVEYDVQLRHVLTVIDQLYPPLRVKQDDIQQSMMFL
jgi:F420-0:gamma-glutamyl ligase-like protein